MSGSPTEAEVRTQWRNAVDVLEDARAFADAFGAASAQLDTLEQSLEGEYTPFALGNASARYRSGLSTLVDPSRSFEWLQPVMLEYVKLVTGGAVTDPALIMRALWEWFHANTYTIQSRNITFDTSATLGGANVGNGVVSRLTQDEQGYALEHEFVETKRIRCVRDQNNGIQKWAEEFVGLGAPASYDALLRGSKGSGDIRAAKLISKHAGSGPGGSLLRNSSFSDYSASASPKFSGWTESAGGSSLTQDTTNYYRTHPGSTVNGSLKITGGGGTVTIKQALSTMSIQRLNFDRPYFLRVMLNKTIGTASGGTVTIRMGSQTTAVTIAALASGWAELAIPLTAVCWPRRFNTDPMDIEIEWSSSISGYLLVDDVIFCEWDFWDGTWWNLRHTAATPTACMIDDTFEFTDTGGAAGTGKLQWWLWVAGLGHLPSTTGSPTVTDP